LVICGADDAEAFIRNGWVKLGEWIENEPPEGEQIAEQNKPKVTYARGSLEWEAQQEQELSIPNPDIPTGSRHAVRSCARQ
jgi:hypothetical protein